MFLKKETLILTWNPSKLRKFWLNEERNIFGAKNDAPNGFIVFHKNARFQVLSKHLTVILREINTILSFFILIVCECVPICTILI